MKDRRDIAVSYSLAGGADVVAEETGFELPPGAWAPALVPPEGQGSFSRGSDAPKKWEMTVRVPADFRVYASGREHGHSNEGPDVEFRFQQRHGGALAFAAGGAYQEIRMAAPGGEVIFWTRQAMPQDAAQLGAGVAAQTVRFFDGQFGARAKDARPVHIIECTSPQPCWAVPGAALPSPELYGAQFWNSSPWPLIRQLARTWLDFRVHPDWREEPYPMGALANYAADLAVAGTGGESARRRIIRERLEEFDHLQLSERAVAALNVRQTDSAAVRQYAEFQSELFFFALEDAAGSENLRRALAHLLGTYAGSTWSASDLRSAVEQECGKDLGPLFRAWLTEAGIPAEFRNRY